MTQFVGYIRRETLQAIAGGDPRALRDLEDQANAVAQATEELEAQGSQTLRMKDASVVVLSSNAEFENERVIEAGDGIELRDEGGKLIVGVGRVGVSTEGGFSCRLKVAGETLLVLPLEGVVATTGNAETLSNKTLKAPAITDLGEYADDVAAARAGVEIGGLYRDGSNLKIRVS